MSTPTEQAVEALEALKHADGCYCDAAFAGPGGEYPSHSSECKAAMAALAALRPQAQEAVTDLSKRLRGMYIEVQSKNPGGVEGFDTPLLFDVIAELESVRSPAKEEEQASEPAEEWPSRTKVLTYILGREQEDIQWLIAKASMVLPKPTPVLTVEQVERLRSFVVASPATSASMSKKRREILEWINMLTTTP